MSKMLKSQGAAEESDSDEVQENFTVAELIAESKLVSQVGGRNARSPGSSFSKEASKSNMPLGSWNNAKSSRSDTSRKAGKWQQLEHAQKSSVQPSATQKKVKLEQDLGVPEKYGFFSLGSCNNAKPSGSSMSRKTEKWIKREGVEKSSVPLATPLKKLKLEHDLVHKHRGTKPLGNSTGNKEGRLHKPEGIQKASVIPAAPPRKRKQDLVASEKNDIYSFVGRSNANVLDNISSKKPHKQREHEETWKPIARPPAPQSILKQQNKTNSSTKAWKQQIPECFQKTSVQPAASQSKPKRSNHVAPGRPKTRSKTSNPARKKEYACVSVWANIYESECSSGSAEPLVNKRTERRKQARERSVQITYSRSRKRSASGISPIKAQPAAAQDEISSQQGKPPPQSQCLQFILIDSAVTQDPKDQSQPQAPSMDIAVPPADKVKTQIPRGHSQLPAQCMDTDFPPADLVTTQTHGGPSIRSTCIGIATVPPADHVMTQAPVHQSRSPAPCSIAKELVVATHSADPPSLTHLNPSSSPDVIDISDDD